jgi:hypothetical protein
LGTGAVAMTIGDVRGKYVSPAIDQTAFNCPHCGALARQFWYSVHAEAVKAQDRKPLLVTPEMVLRVRNDPVLEEVQRDEAAQVFEQLAKGRPFLSSKPMRADDEVENVWLSYCSNPDCREICLWVYDQLLWPRRAGGPQPNLDLSPEVRGDYDEASTILDASPRGAAALLRLAIEKLCKELGEKGKDLNADIASLVSKGLDKRVQHALDAVRVIGNHAVHPGQIDLRDDRQTAEALFGLVNLICEKMITEPKHVDEVYAKLPESALEAIEKRDKPKQ